MEHKIHKLTRERYKAYEDELKYYNTVRKNEVAEQINLARSFGDLSENSEYDEARNEQGRLYGHIAEIEDILAHAVIIDDDAEFGDTVDVGCEVTIIRVGRDGEIKYRVVGEKEANPAERKISDESPLGRALVGARVGDTVSYEAPAGTMSVTITGISR